MSRRVAVRRAAAVVLGVNLALALSKVAVWWESGSLAVGSEAVNSLADTVYSLVVLVGMYLTTRPPDPEHPHGHERIEPFVSLVVAAGVLVAGILVFRQAVLDLLGGVSTRSVGPLAVGVLLGSIAAKFWLYRYCLGVGRRQQSPATVATALDNRTDVFSATAALVGVLGVRFGYPVLDPIAALAVGAAILSTGVGIVTDNVGYLIGSAPSEELREEILRRALAHSDVEGAHDVVTHYVGPEVDVSLHIEVQGDRTLLEAHDIESEVATSIRDIEQVDDVFVHVDPRELGEWKSDEDVDRLLDGEDRDRNAGRE
ncbi:MAG: cation diffusion facilitator family transporter [Halanaeroarchaeum sp.]